MMALRSYCSLFVLAAAAPAAAHVTLNDAHAPAGGYYVGFFRVSHGCASSPTVSIRVEIPPTIVSAKPQPKPGWTLKVEKASLATPMKAEGGGEIRDRVSAITWTGRLEPDQFDQFGVMLKLPDTVGPIYFPTVQRCESGENDWTMIPAAGQPWHSVKAPAPVLELTRGDDAPMPAMKM